MPKYLALRASKSPNRQISSIKDTNQFFLATWSLGKQTEQMIYFVVLLPPPPPLTKGRWLAWRSQCISQQKKKKKIVVHKSNFLFCTIYSLCWKLTWLFKPSDAFLHLYLLRRKHLTRSQRCEFSWGWIRCSHCHGWEVADNVIYTDWKTTSEEKTE